MGLGKEVIQGIALAVLMIAICVVIGSQIANAGHHDAPAHTESTEGH